MSQVYLNKDGWTPPTRLSPLVYDLPDSPHCMRGKQLFGINAAARLFLVPRGSRQALCPEAWTGVSQAIECFLSDCLNRGGCSGQWGDPGLGGQFLLAELRQRWGRIAGFAQRFGSLTWLRCGNDNITKHFCFWVGPYLFRIATRRLNYETNLLPDRLSEPQFVKLGECPRYKSVNKFHHCENLTKSYSVVRKAPSWWNFPLQCYFLL